MELCSPGLVCEPLGVWPVQVQNPFLSPLVLVVVLQVLCGLKHERGMWGWGWGWGQGWEWGWGLWWGWEVNWVIVYWEGGRGERPQAGLGRTTDSCQ